MSYVPATLLNSGFVQDIWRNDEPFGQPPSFNMPMATQKDPAMYMGNGVAIPARDAPGLDRKENLQGLSERTIHQKTLNEKKSELNYLYLAAFVAVLAVALI